VRSGAGHLDHQVTLFSCENHISRVDDVVSFVSHQYLFSPHATRQADLAYKLVPSRLKSQQYLN